MKCPSCNKTASIAIGTKHYCTNCGERMSMATDLVAIPKRVPKDPEQPEPPKPIAPAPSPPPVVRSLDMSRPSSRSSLSLEPRRRGMSPVVAPVPSARLMRDVVTTGNTLDLRTTKPTPSPASVPTKPSAKHIAVAASKIHTPAKAQTEAPSAVSSASRQRQLQSRLEAAVQISRSQVIGRFTSQVAPPLPSRPEPTPDTAAVAPATLPSQASAQHEHLSRLLELSAQAESMPPRWFGSPSRTGFASAAIAIAVMGGYIWLHNYPHLAMSSASSRAGFSATLPGYVPSSYNLKGSPSYAPGLVTLSFSSPSFNDSLKVTQQPTSWDSSSLLDNYVTAKSSDYSTVSGQGLTIYIFDSNQRAAWVNHGIWYTVEGAAHLGRDQLLKMAYSF